MTDEKPEWGTPRWTGQHENLTPEFNELWRQCRGCNKVTLHAKSTRNDETTYECLECGDKKRYLSMPDPPGTTRIEIIRKYLNGEEV